MKVWLLWQVDGEYESDNLIGVFHTEASAVREARRLKISKRERSIYPLLVQGRPAREGAGKEKL